MYPRRGIVTLVASCVVEIGLCVPGFSQSNTAYRAAIAVERTAANAMREYVPESVSDIGSADPPSNLVVPPAFRTFLQSMLDRSPTFRRQCLRIANESRLVVTLQPGYGPGHSQTRARTRIVRQSSQILAAIEVFRFDEPAELIAHEFEHIIEQLDGVDLASRVGLTSSGVHAGTADPSAFETTRATRMGQRVAAEIRRSGN